MCAQSSGIVYLVGGGPGDPGLITLRGMECLQQADVVVHDRLVNRALLAYALQAEFIDVGKRPDRHRMSQKQINDLLVEQAQAGKVVVRLKGGDPFVFGRGGEEACRLAEAGVAYEIIPGVTSAVAAPAYAGIPLTHRGTACSAAVITGHRAKCSDDSAAQWRRMADGADTLVFLMGVHNLPQIVTELRSGGLPAETPIALVEQATTSRQRTVTGTLQNIVERASQIKPPAVIVVGQVVSLRESLRWYDRREKRPLLGFRVLNTRPCVELPCAGQRSLGQEGAGCFTYQDNRDEFSRELAALGAEEILLPTIRIQLAEDRAPLEEAIQRIVSGQENGRPYQWLVFPDIHSVQVFFCRLNDLGCDLRSLGGIGVATVDRVTSNALRSHGIFADFTPVQETPQALAAGLPLAPQRRVLLPGPDVPFDGLAAALERRGALVETVGAYSIQPIQADLETLELLLAGEFEAAVFFSISSLVGLAAMLDGHNLPETLAPLQVICVGSAVQAAAQQMGVRVDVATEKFTVAAVCQALVARVAAQTGQSQQQVEIG